MDLDFDNCNISSGTETWDRVVTVSTLSPHPRSQLVSLVTRCRQPLLLTSAPAAPGTPSITRQARAVVQKLRDEAGSILESRHSGRQRYSFLPPDSCAEDSEEEEEVKYQRYKELPRDLIRDFTRSSQFQRLDPVKKTKDARSSIVKDFAKVNLSLLQSSQYNVLTNQSSDSINSIQHQQQEEVSYDLQRPMTKSDSVSTWQSYSCSSTLSSHFRDFRDFTEVNTEVSITRHW